MGERVTPINRPCPVSGRRRRKKKKVLLLRLGPRELVGDVDVLHHTFKLAQRLAHLHTTNH
jgi:hypothetical protein